MVKGAVLLIEDEAARDDDEAREEDSPPAALGSPTKADLVSDARHRQIQAMVELLRPEDTIKLAVQLESVNPVRVRFLIVVSTLGNKDESVLLGMDFPNADSKECTIGLVLPIWSDTQVYLDGDGGFSVTSAEETRKFKPVSMQTMWSVLQALHGCCERAVKSALIPGAGLEWAEHYHGHVESDRVCRNEWEAMDDLESVRRDSEGSSSEDRFSKEQLIKEQLRDIMMTEDLDNLTAKMVHTALNSRLGFDIRPFREYIDNEILVTMAQMDKPSQIFDYLFLGSEWNAANIEELQKNNVGYILNVTREIDNFFPASFAYMNIRVYDVEATDLLSHWADTFNFINHARKSGQAVFVHCKMGISRSASTVIAYAMKQYHWPLEVALAYVKERRSIIKPNEGFMKQLQTYSGILSASQQRHSSLWRRKSRDQRQKSLSKDNEEQMQTDADKEEDEEDEELEDDVDSGEEEEESSVSEEETEEVFKESGPGPGPGPEQKEAGGTNPTITVSEPSKVASSVSRSGRMNLFSLMQSISELDDDLPGHDKLPGSPRRSPGQRRRSHARRGLTHQRECVDVSPEPRSLNAQGPKPNEGPEQ